MTYVIIKNEEKNQSYSRSVKAVEELDLEAFSSNLILELSHFVRAYTSNEVSDKPAHSRSLARIFTARTLNV